MNMFFSRILFFVLTLTLSASAFVPCQTFTQQRSYDISLALVKPTIQDMPTSSNVLESLKRVSGVSTVVGVSTILYPLVALAGTCIRIQVDFSFRKTEPCLSKSSNSIFSFLQAETQGENYEYGAVNAPIAIPLVGGLLAILTALIPVFFKGGEQAFEEIKERDSETFGKNNSVLNKKK